MSPGIFRRLFSREKRRRFFAWQIELTTRCPLRCRMCMRTAAEDWHAADMPLDAFKRLSPYLRDVENVVLEGWGEPLVYPDLVDAIRIVKGEGARAGFVTGGRDLTTGYVRDLTEAGLDFVGFSLAGATPRTHGAVRVHSDLAVVLRAVETFRRIGGDRGPNLHIVYLMLKENLAEIPLLLDLAKDAGIGTIFLINLVQISNAWQNEQKVFSCGPVSEHEDFLKEMELKAKRLGIVLRKPFLSPQRIGICAENPLKNLYVSVTGQVAPCVHLNPPVPSPLRRIYCNEESSLEKVSFGNIFETPLHRIWNDPGYAAFRKRFEDRQREFEELYSFAAVVAPDTRHLDDAENLFTDPPRSCTTCHKMLGI